MGGRGGGGGVGAFTSEEPVLSFKPHLNERLVGFLKHMLKILCTIEKKKESVGAI